MLDQLEQNPDSRLLNSAVRYLCGQDRSLKMIGECLANFLAQQEELFAYQQAHFFMTVRYLRNIPTAAWQEARRQVRLKNGHWYVRQQAAILVGMKKLSRREIEAARKAYEQEENPEVKRAWIQGLAQLPRQELEELVRRLVFVVDPKLQRLGRFYHGLLFDEAKGKEQAKSIFNGFTEDTLLDRLYEVEILSKGRHPKVKELLLHKLREVRQKIRRPLLKDRAEEIMERLQKESQSQ